MTPATVEMKRAAKIQLRLQNEMSLEQLLAALCAFGQPRLYRMDKGWHLCVRMHVAQAGASFEVMSDFDCKTIPDAKKQLVERLLATLDSMV